MFLENVALQIIHNFQNYQGLYVILPNRRSAEKFKKYVVEHIKKPNWLPQIMAIRDFVFSFSELNEVDGFQLLLLLFDELKKYFKDKEKEIDFDDFLYLGQHILSDFDTVEKELTPNEINKLFRFISEIKEIDELFDFLNDEQKIILKEFWKNVEISDDKHLVKSYFTEFWKMMWPIFENIQQKLTANEFGYEAMAYRKTQENLMNIPDRKLPSFCFIGFNALTKVQIEMFSFLKEKGKAHFYWDYDSRFDFSKSARFIYDNISTFGNEFVWKNNLDNKINIVFNEYPVPSETLQIDTLATILNEVSENDKTCIVLNDENLLLPLMDLIMKSPEKYNVSTGLPVTYLPPIQFLELILEVKLNMKDRLVFYNSLINLLSNPFMRYMENGVFHNTFSCQNLIQKINERNLQYLSLNYLKTLIPEPIIKLFDTSEVKDLSNEWHLFFNSLKRTDNDNDEQNQFYQLAITQTLKIIEIIAERLDKLQGNSISLKGYRTIFKMVATEEKIHFQTQGKTENRIQVMGLLETRLLDFDNVIFLSANDENFPKLTQNNSLIPFNIKKAFNLPTFENQEAIYSYSFYRLLYRAKKVFFIYNAIQDEFNRGEKSRFIYQLQFQKGLNFNKYSNETKNSFFNSEKYLEIKKEGGVLSDMEGIKHFSSSALTTYLDCPLKYYFEYVKKLKEPDIADEDISSASMGNIFHAVMRRLLKPGNYTTSTIENILKDKSIINQIIREEFLNEMENHSDTKLEDSGVFVFMNETINYFVTKSLNYDMKFVPFEILGSETPIDLPIEIMVDNQSKKFPLKGSIDRYDLRQNQIHIIDYKTGKIKLDFEGMDLLFTVGINDENYRSLEKRNYIFQLLFYAFAISKKMTNKTFILRNYSVVSRMIDDSDSFIKFEKEKLIVDEKILAAYEKSLKSLISEIYNKDIPFKASVSKNCNYCPYNNICSV